MGIDDCAVNPDNFNIGSKQTKSQNHSKLSNESKLQLKVDQIKSGLTVNNSFLNVTNKEKKEINFLQLYLALNKPSTLKLKYDWIIGFNNNSSDINASSSNSNLSNNAQLCSQSVSSSSTSAQTLASKQNQQQRFYIDTLASVAASFLNDMQKYKQDIATNNNQSNQKPQQDVINIANKPVTSNQQFKSPTNPASAPQQSIAFLQPSSSSSKQQATILPLETVLQRLNEEQTNKTKKLLSDLNSKRRSRQRKPIMVVNTSHAPRTMLPKLNISNNQQLFLNPSNSEATYSAQENQPQQQHQQQQQNIVFSGPMAAIARQIVNSSSSSNSQQNETHQMNKQNHHLQKMNQTNAISNSLYQDDNNQAKSPKIVISSFQQAYSNLIPQILNNLMENNKDDLAQNSSREINLEQNDSPPNLADMSLLDISISNGDSLFGSSAIRVNSDQHDAQIASTIDKSGASVNKQIDENSQSFDNNNKSPKSVNCVINVVNENSAMNSLTSE